MLLKCPVAVAEALEVELLLRDVDVLVKLQKLEEILLLQLTEVQVTLTPLLIEKVPFTVIVYNFVPSALYPVAVLVAALLEERDTEGSI